MQVRVHKGRGSPESLSLSLSLSRQRTSTVPINEVSASPASVFLGDPILIRRQGNQALGYIWHLRRDPNDRQDGGLAGEAGQATGSQPSTRERPSINPADRPRPSDLPSGASPKRPPHPAEGRSCRERARGRTDGRHQHRQPRGLTIGHHDGRPRAVVSIMGVLCMTLIDKGAARSLISAPCWQRIAHPECRKQPTPVVLQKVSGAPLQTSGKVEFLQPLHIYESKPCALGALAAVST